MSSASLIEQVADCRLPLVVYRPDVGWCDEVLDRAIVLAGSFRPLHRAHRSLLKSGLEMFVEPLNPYFEISIRNVEKAEITVSDLYERLNQFREPGDAVVVTRSATFLEKARLMPGSIFIIGYDTAIRLFDDRFYADDVASTQRVGGMRDALREIADLGSRFAVGGRHDEDGDFKTMRDLEIPDGLESLLVEIPERVFSDPISSTSLRCSGNDLMSRELKIGD